MKQPDLHILSLTLHCEHSCSFPAVTDDMNGGKGLMLEAVQAPMK